MGRPRRPASPQAAARPKRAANPFDELATLREKLKPISAPSAQRGRAPSPPPGKPDLGADLPSRPNPGGDAAEDLELFRDAVGDVRPLSKATPRAEIDRPKPAPLPRPRGIDAEDDGPAARPLRSPPADDRSLFRSAVGDVAPLKYDARADVGRAPRSAYPLRSDAHPDAAAADSGALLLPADADAIDPSELFRYASRGAQPIDSRNRAELASPPPSPEPLQHREDERAALRESLDAPMSLEDRLEMGDEAVFLRPGLPRRVLTDLRRGRWVLQGEVDLHGCNREEARAVLARFLATSLQQGRRCVRVIHGKGLGSPGKLSILKQLSRGWLAQREEILAFCQAGPYEGGSGALLVLLRAGTAVRE
jgi:DNA-nicking Smr family endonuclease